MRVNKDIVDLKVSCYCLNISISLWVVFILFCLFLWIILLNLDLLFLNSIIYDVYLFIDYKEWMNMLFYKNYCFIIIVFVKKKMIKYFLKNL